MNTCAAPIIGARKLVDLHVASVVRGPVGSKVAVNLLLLTPLARLLLLAFQLCRCTRRTRLRNPGTRRRFRCSLPLAAAFVDVVAGDMPLEEVARSPTIMSSSLSCLPSDWRICGERLTLSQRSYCILSKGTVSPWCLPIEIRSGKESILNGKKATDGIGSDGQDDQCGNRSSGRHYMRRDYSPPPPPYSFPAAQVRQHQSQPSNLL